MRSHREEFPDSVKVARFNHANGKCEQCLRKIVRVAIYDHFPIPAALGGPGTFENCRVLCGTCNDEITNTKDKPAIAKSKRILETRMGLRAKKRGGFRKAPENYDAFNRRWRDE